jgi:hypothetical protein
MKTFINIPLLIEQLKRFWVIPVFTFAGFVLAVVLPVYLTEPTGWNCPTRMMVSLLSMNNPVMIAASLLVPLSAAVALFPYHFNGVVNTAFAAFPVRKQQLFFTNMLAGVLMFAVPLLLMSLLVLIPLPANEWVADIWVRPWQYHVTSHIWRDGLHNLQIINTLPVVTGFFLRSMLTFGFYFAMGVLAVSLTGNKVISILVASVISVLPVTVLGLINSIGDLYLFGYPAQGMLFTDRIMYFFHPVTMGSILNSPWRNGHLTGGAMWPLYLIYFLTIAGMLVIGWLCCLRRKAENAGESMAFEPLKNTMVLILSLTGMFIGGVLVPFFIGGGRTGYYVGFIIGFVIAYFIAQMIAEKSLHIRHKARSLHKFGGVAVGLYISMLVITHGLLWGYVSHVPNAEDIEGVYIGRRIFNHQEEGLDYVFITDRSIIERTRDAHNQIISERRTIRNHFWTNTMFNNQIMVHSDFFPIVYRLHCGRLIQRSYTLPLDFVQRSGIEALIQDEAVILSRHPELLNPASIVEINLNMPEQFVLLFYQEFSPLTITNPAQILSLAVAMRRDVIATAQIDRRRQLGEVGLPFTRDTITGDLRIISQVIVDGRTRTIERHRTIRLGVFDHTLEWLRWEWIRD